MELNILALLSTKENFDKFKSQFKKGTVSKEVFTILAVMEEYFSKFSVPQIYWNDFSTYFCVVKYSYWKADELAFYRELFNNLTTHVVAKDFEEQLLDTLHKRYYAGLIADKATDIAMGGSADIDDLDKLLEDYYTKYPKLDEHIDLLVSDDLEELIDNYTHTSGWKWRLKELNLSLGELRQGDLILIGARPDGGKTTLLASEATYIAEQLPTSLSVLWFNNEEQGYKVRFRVIQACLGISMKEILDDPVSVKNSYYSKLGKDKIIIFDSSNIRARDVAKMINKYPPGLLIFDQLSKINVDSTSTLDAEKLTDVAKYARSLAKVHAPVLGTIWADGAAEGVKYIQQNQLYGSKTGMQGEADAIITIGRVHDGSVSNDTRFLYVPKNKLFGNDESLRNGTFEVTIHPTTARFSGRL